MLESHVRKAQDECVCTSQLEKLCQPKYLEHWVHIVHVLQRKERVKHNVIICMFRYFSVIGFFSSQFPGIVSSYAWNCKWVCFVKCSFVKNLRFWCLRKFAWRKIDAVESNTGKQVLKNSRINGWWEISHCCPLILLNT